MRLSPGAKGQNSLTVYQNRRGKNGSNAATLINEKRLNVFDADAKKFLEEQREKFFSNDESVEKPKVGSLKKNKARSYFSVRAAKRLGLTLKSPHLGLFF